MLQNTAFVHPNVTYCLPGSHWDPTLLQCVADPTCQNNYHFDPVSLQCVVNSTPQNNGSNWGDSIQRPTILGIKLTNPYTLDLMAQAYANLGITNVSVVPTHTYVRFLPSDFSQFSSLVDYMETQNLEVEETPTEYNTDVEGDYYQDPGFTSEQIPWLYSTVPVGFTFPAGISYQVIAQIHIPGDNFTAVETEAERLASNIDNGGGTSPASVSKGVVPNVTYCLQGYYYNTTQHTCVPIPFCGNGSHFESHYKNVWWMPAHLDIIETPLHSNV